MREKLLALQTTASLLHVTAHPDDEHGGMLALLARGQGARTILVSLTRGEAGANAIGPELFDGLGWIRAEELRVAGRYYGLDALYFTRLADYGYSKRLSEAESKWGKEDALRDLVYLIRKERPLVVVSRFQGNERDGHGQHQFAGVLAREAFRAAGDPDAFPELGVSPWQPLKLYIGGVREDEDWNVVVDSGVYDPWLGDSYENVAREGLGFQRSQNGGRVRRVEGSFRRYYRRIESLVGTSEKEQGFFDGIKTSTGLDLVDRFDPDRPESIVPELLRRLEAGPLETRQLHDALRAALGIRLTATASIGPVAPGDRFDVELSLWNPSGLALRLQRARLVGEDFLSPEAPAGVALGPGTTWSHVFGVEVAENAAVFGLSSQRESTDWFLGAPPPRLTAEVAIELSRTSFDLRVPVEWVQARLPYGEVRRELAVLPPVSLSVRPRLALLREESIDVSVEATSHGSSIRSARIELELPSGLAAEPAFFDFTPTRAGESKRFVFRVRGRAEGEPIRAAARVGSKTYRDSIVPLEHRDLETRYLVTRAEVQMLPLDVVVPADLEVGYVMGVGDEVPDGIEALGARVEMLTTEALAAATLDPYDAIVLGTRAYAVRDDLLEYNGRLLDYVREGGHLVVLYNTPEFQPSGIAPYPGELLDDAEEVSEEGAPVTILAPSHPLLNWPNRIGPADFDSWFEQRGSKFWSRWDDAYVPLVSSHDEGQEPQKGGWLTASYGEGHYTYFAYALHRQLPAGVPGAYRLLANLLSLRRHP